MAGVWRKSWRGMRPHIPVPNVDDTGENRPRAAVRHTELTDRRMRNKIANGAARRAAHFVSAAPPLCAACTGHDRDIAFVADLCAREPCFRAGRGRLACSQPTATAISISPPASRSMRSGTLIRALSPRSTEQAHKVWHVSNLYEIPEAERVAQRLCEASFADFVFFCNSGAEAMECAIKMARKYHFGERRSGTLPDHHLRGRLPRPHAGNARRRRAEEISRWFRPGGRGFRSGAVRRSRRGQGARSAARPRRSSIEPIMGEGGVRVVEPSFLRALARTLRPARLAPDLRRGADRYGPHRRTVRLPAHRRRAATSWRSPRRSAAASRSGRAWRRAEAAQGNDRRHARLDLRRQSAGDERRRRRARRDARARLSRTRAADRAAASSSGSRKSRIAIRR